MAVSLGTGTVATASTQSELDAAKARLSAIEHQIDSQRGVLAQLQAKLDDLQGKLNVLAAKVAAAQSQYAITQQKIDTTRGQIQAARKEYLRLQAQLDARARAAYIEGPGNSLELILGSSSIADFSDRVEFVGRVAVEDSDLANLVQNQANDLKNKQISLEALRAKQAAIVGGLKDQQAGVNTIMTEQQDVYTQQQGTLASLAASKSALLSEASKLQGKLDVEARAAAAAAAAAAGGGGGTPITGGPGPFFTCPVAGPHSYSDDFGQPRYGGGYHTHQGNDILAPYGTPIVAPFPGTASNSTNSIGGLAVIVSGAQGYVYNAHMSGFGHLGAVSTGTVIGYVGTSGDAAGGPPHDHFEWHPGGGAAVDPFPYLNEVC
jgi:peptidoglycan LD-endopeptidase LytH